MYSRKKNIKKYLPTRKKNRTNYSRSSVSCAQQKMSLLLGSFSGHNSRKTMPAIKSLALFSMFHLNSLLSRPPLCGLLHGAGRERRSAAWPQTCTCSSQVPWTWHLPKLLRSPEGGGFSVLWCLPLYCNHSDRKEQGLREKGRFVMWLDG